MYSCWTCQGTGVVEITDLSHHTDCNSTEFCELNCPIAFPVQERCDACNGTRWVFYATLKARIIHDVKDNLRAVEILENYKEKSCQVYQKKMKLNLVH